MSNDRISASTIHRATILQALTDIGAPSYVEDVNEILLPPNGYPTSATLHNMCKAGFIDKIDGDGRMMRGRAVKKFTISDKGIEYLNSMFGYVQTYGEYEIITTLEASTKAKQPSLPLEPTPPSVVSPTVKKAMDELAQVASINEHAHNCLSEIDKTIQRLWLKKSDTSYKVSGSLKMIQDHTKSMHKLIREMEKNVAEALELEDA